MADATPPKRKLAPSDAEIRAAWSPGVPALDDVLGDLATDMLDLSAGTCTRSPTRMARSLTYRAIGASATGCATRRTSAGRPRLS